MSRLRSRLAVALCLALATTAFTVTGWAAERPGARPPVDAPELAALGEHAVGVAELHWVQKNQPDPLQGDKAPAVADRALRVVVWYPTDTQGAGVTYRSSLYGPDAVAVPFTLPGLAIAEARPAAGHFPLVVLAHGYGNTPEALAWLGENLASKGYVVVAPDFTDPPISQRAKMIGPLARRPQDIAFVVATARAMSLKGQGPLIGADASRTALIGYSMGGYGVLAASGAPLSPGLVGPTRGVLAPFVVGAPRASELVCPDLKAVVAMAPASRLGGLDMFAPGALEKITAPTLFIVGSQDHSVGYDPGVRTLFGAETHAPRYLLTFLHAAHSIVLGPLPKEMQDRSWDKDWFEDPVWRKDRLMSIETHFITAFLDRHVKGDMSRAGYLEGLVEQSDDGVWTTAPTGRYAGFSPGGAVSLWKGFQPNHANGLRFEFKPAP